MHDGPEFGLALSGGTARSIAHIGVLKVLEQEGMRPDLIAATSGGSLIAAMWAGGIETDALARMATEINWRKLARVRIPRLGLLSNQGIEDLVIEHIGDVDFSELRIPLHVVATDLLSGEKKVFSTGKVARAVRASCSIPQIFSPVEIDGGLYADGGFVEYMPVETARALGCRVVAGVNLSRYADFSERPGNLIDMIQRMVGIIARQNGRISSLSADCVIEPRMQGFGSFDLGRADDLIHVGQLATREVIGCLREAFAPDAEDGVWAKLQRRLGLAL